MKSHIDRLMSDRNLDAIIVSGPDGLTSHNAAWNYMVRGQQLTGTVVKLRGKPAQLIFGSMERLQAEATGLELVPSSKWNYPEILKKSPGDLLSASVELWKQRFGDLGIKGRVGWYGTVESGSFLALTERLRAAVPSVMIIGEFDKGVIDEARKTKDADEIAIMADVGMRASEVVAQVVGYIRPKRGVDNVLVDSQNKPITIGDVKALIRREIDARSLEHPDPVIFSQGRDSGIGHATGDDPAPIRLNESIVFDFFPRDRKTGYYHDMTRTVSIGSAPDELRQVYDDVRAVFDMVMSSLKVGERSKRYQELTCEEFAKRGHKTIDKHWPLEEGYCHSLGHGIGLEVHEPLAFSSFVDRGDTLQPGCVFTIEPGLYYPDRRIGVRVEDTVACLPDGSFRSLTPAPYDLVIQLR